MHDTIRLKSKWETESKSSKSRRLKLDVSRVKSSESSSVVPLS